MNTHNQRNCQHCPKSCLFKIPRQQTSPYVLEDNCHCHINEYIILPTPRSSNALKRKMALLDISRLLIYDHASLPTCSTGRELLRRAKECYSEFIYSRYEHRAIPRYEPRRANPAGTAYTEHIMREGSYHTFHFDDIDFSAL